MLKHVYRSCNCRACRAVPSAIKRAHKRAAHRAFRRAGRRDPATIAAVSTGYRA